MDWASYSRKRRAVLRELGLCQRCERSLDDETKSCCARCLAAVRASALARYHMKRALAE